jgi:arylsulfatase A-like enzyme
MHSASQYSSKHAAKISPETTPQSLPEASLPSAILSLWHKLTTLGVIGLMFAEALYLGSSKVQGWTFYLTAAEVAFEVTVRLIFAALAGVALATICTVLFTPLLWYFTLRRQQVVEWIVKIGVILVVFGDSRFALTSLIKWSNRGVRFTTALLVAHFIFFIAAICIPRLRREIVSSLDGFLDDSTSRHIALGTIVATVALAAVELLLSKRVAPVQAATFSAKPKSNILLISFDALDAEDLSLYGRNLPTTPNLDAFAQHATVFTNFYSASTFTTSGIATMMTGRYPSETRVLQVQGILRGDNSQKTLAQVMHSRGYTTAAFLSNPWAYYLAKTGRSDYDYLPLPKFEQGGIQRTGLQRLWSATTFLHQDSGLGSRVDEYFDLENLWNSLGLPQSHSFRFRPAATFEHAQEILTKLPDGFFFWVHVTTPHDPYLPDPADQGRFIPYTEQRAFEDESVTPWRPHYDLSKQHEIDRRRLLYDEFVSTADRAFGSFISDLEKHGKLNNTTIIITADHGESFEGGVYRHEVPDQTRPVIHIPLIIRTPGQSIGHTVAFTADQSALAPTILDLAGIPKPVWMPGQSLISWLGGEADSAGKGLAFTQFFEKNSVFKSVRHGTIGVIAGQYQYVLDLDTKKGTLRPLNQAQIWNLDRSAENPAKANELLAAIYGRFPELKQASK